MQTQAEEEIHRDTDVYAELVEAISTEHGDEVAETANVYLEIYLQQDGPGKKVKQQQVARALGKHPKTIKRHIEKIEQFLRERMKKD